MRAKAIPAGAGIEGASSATISGLSAGVRLRAAAPLAGVLGVALGLRLWGIKQGLPYVYNVDEYGHFVPEAIAMFHHGLNPHYFVNPPALTYFFHAVDAVLLGGTAATVEFARHPDHVYLIARVTVAVLGTVSVWLLYILGARLFDRRVGLAAALLLAVAFLPVYYGHLALNDAPTLVPLTVSLIGAAGVLRRGRAVDYLLAGAGLGVATATKYTAVIVLLSLLAAVGARYLQTDPPGRLRVAAWGACAVLVAIVSFVIANPYAVLDFHTFSKELIKQSEYTQMSPGSWVGGPGHSGFVYYLWSFTWGLGWVPSLAALGGLVTVWVRDRATALLLAPTAICYLAIVSLEGRYFGRWLLPILPLACLLAAHFALTLARAGERRAPRLRGALAAVAVAALAAQGLLYSVHAGLVLSRADTRNLARAWMVAHVAPGERVVVEPVVPNVWLMDRPGEGSTARGGFRWAAYQTLRLALNPATGAPEPAGRSVALEDYERTLGPALVPYYEAHGYCWVVSGYTQSGRAFVDPRALPHAIAYYRELAAQARVVYRVSPYRRGQEPVGFDFDWTFDYYPLAYERPGAQIVVYHLDRGRCAHAHAPEASRRS